MSKIIKPTGTFVISLIAGILILFSGIVTGLIASFMASIIGPIQIGRISIDIYSILYPLMAWKIILGIILIIASVSFYRNPLKKTLWGTIILVLSIMSVFPPGPIGFAGAMLGIISGILVLSWQPK